MIDAHRRTGAVATVGTYRRDLRIDLGVIEADEEHRVRRYIEKPTHHFLVSMGVYVLEPAVLERIPEGTRFDLPDLIGSLLEAGQEVGSFEHPGYWLDIGRPEDYEQAQADVELIKGRVLG
jgi:NDP-sugar pyrophosphorylase family protein